MKHVANIEPGVSRSFDLPLEKCDGELLTYSLPAFDCDWHPLSERFLDGVDFASRLTGAEVIVSDGSVYATDNLIAVEYDIGETCPFKLTLGSKEVRAIKAFGSAPSHAYWSGVFRKPQKFMWSNGSRLKLAHRDPCKNAPRRVRLERPT